jgi:hypothetical protein
LLFALDEAAMRRYYWRFCQLYGARPNQHPSQDLVDFGDFIEGTLAVAENLPKYAADLAKYERLYVRAMLEAGDAEASAAALQSEPGREGATLDARPRLVPRVEIADFAFDVSKVEESLRNGQPIDERKVAGPCSIVFIPGMENSGVRMLRINEVTKTLVTFCDGTRTLSEIVSTTQSVLGATKLESGIVDAINKLIAARVLSLGAVSAPHRAVAPPFYAGSVAGESM